jgi:uncharacterized protein YjbJ (UPF0337 family)
VGSDQGKGRRKPGAREITDDDFKKPEGSMDKLYGVIQKKFGDTKESRNRLKRSSTRFT